LILGNTVQTHFQGDPDVGAETSTPSNPLLIFLNPDIILYSGQGRNLANEGLLFREALHGWTSFQDGALLIDLGYGGDNLAFASCNITVYIQQRVLSWAQNLNPGTNNALWCPNAVTPPANSPFYE
jgi:hypothetical protein